MPAAIAAWDASGSINATVGQLVDFLRAWDFAMDTDIRSPTVWLHLFDAIRYELFDELHYLEDLLDTSVMKSNALPSTVYPRSPMVEKIVLDNNSAFIDDKRTAGEVETLNDILVHAFHRAANVLYDSYGPDPANWYYGLHHTLNIEHMAGLTTIEGGGIRGQHTLFPSHGWEMSTGPVYRSVIDLAIPLNSHWVIAGGQSGNPFSIHFDDLFRMYFAFNETAQHYGYHKVYVHAGPANFETSEPTGTIERKITLLGPPVF